MRLHSIEMLHLPPHTDPVHEHDWSEMVYVVKGAYRVDCEDEVLSGGSHHVFYYPAGMPHAPVFPGTEVTQLYVIQFFEDAIDHDRPRTVHDASGRLLVGTEWLWECFPFDGDADRRAAEGLLTALLHQYQRIVHQEDNDLIRRMRHKLLQDLSYPFTLEIMAMIAGYSKFHFVRLFRDLTGTTPMKYLQRLRVQRAIHLLQQTSLPLKDIATMVGFAQPDSLSRLIRRESGHTPTALRRR